VVPYEHGLLNAVGLSNPGAQAMANEIKAFRLRSSTPVIASVFGGSPEEFAEAAAIVAQAAPHLIEVNVSCPNVESEFGLPFSLDFVATARITRLVKEAVGPIPVSVKLSPQASPISRLAAMCEDNGADAITAINTVGPGMLIDTGTMRPVLSNLSGGVSGPAVLPIAVRAVYEIYRSVSIPIIGMGGVTNANDALQLIMAGAAAVGIGSGIHYQGLAIFEEVCRGIRDFLDARRIPSLLLLRGAAHA